MATILAEGSELKIGEAKSALEAHASGNTACVYTFG
jgi:hypothetical protein